eukprot:6446338-Prymnesium_polylepis.1
MVVAVLISIFFPRVGDNNPITKIPVIGGYFARTDAPETCTHRFSNEATLPGPLRYPCFRVRYALTLARARPVSDGPARACAAAEL